MSVSCVCRVHWHSQFLHAFKLQQRPDIFWLFSDVILKEPVTKFGSSCYRQILDFKERQYLTLD